MKRLLPLSLLFFSLQSGIVAAKLDLLEKPAKSSSLAAKSVLLAFDNTDNLYTAVGERGHIINWHSADNWQQQNVPVSVTLTGITKLSDGTMIAVGHDAVILRKTTDSDQWEKVFDGYQLTELKVALLSNNFQQQKQALTKITDEDELEEAEYQLEELEFALEDAQAERDAGPSKPLLSVVALQDKVFATGAYGTLLVSTDRGMTWHLEDQNVENPDQFHLNSIVKNAQQQLFIVGENGLGFRSLDQGESWETMYMPYQGSLFGVAAHPTKQHLVAFGLQGHVMVSVDSGENWQMVDMPARVSVLGGTVDANGTAYLVGHGGAIFSFSVAKPEQVSVIKHPSGASFSAVSAKQNQLVLAGQFGITHWQLK